MSVHLSERGKLLDQSIGSGLCGSDVATNYHPSDDLKHTKKSSTIARRKIRRNGICEFLEKRFRCLALQNPRRASR